MDIRTDCQDVTAERLWALEPGFQYYAAKGKKRKFAFFFFRARFFVALPCLFGFALTSAKKWRPPLIIRNQWWVSYFIKYQR
jgi:hypothetical protein